MASTPKVCECADGLCPVNHGAKFGQPSPRCGKPASVRLYRVDVDDASGTLFCEACADDAYTSGLFADEIDSYNEFKAEGRA